MMVVNSTELAANPAFGKALVGAWYETMAIIAGSDDAAKAARTAMGQASGTDLAGYDAQLAATRMFFTPAEAVSFATSPDLVATMDSVRRFSDAHGCSRAGWTRWASASPAARRWATAAI